MPKAARVRKASTHSKESAAVPDRVNSPMNASAMLGGVTGRYLVLLKEDVTPSDAQTFSRKAGVKMTRSADFGAESIAEGVSALASGEGMLLEKIGVMVVNSPPDQVRGFAIESADSGIVAVEPERIVYALQDRPTSSSELHVRYGTADAEYFRGYRDAVNYLVSKILGESTAGAAPSMVQAAIDESQNTWGLQATKVVQSRFSGRGIKVAVLDTGLDLQHPDFAGRHITAASFVSGETPQDGHGHGTHCIGTSCGPRQPSQPPRYGIACDADIYAGKVLSNAGTGADGGILAGINWAVTNQCAVISMSLGAPTQPGQAFSVVFENAARRALLQGSLIIAAAGNESKRPAIIAPVGHPANCPSIMAVGAVDESLAVAPFSCGGSGNDGGQVDIAGPGVGIDSSWPLPRLRNRISGTSMATPHVSGIAALYAEGFPAARGHALWTLLVQGAKRLSAPSTDVGAGLVQAG